MFEFSNAISWRIWSRKPNERFLKLHILFQMIVINKFYIEILPSKPVKYKSAFKDIDLCYVMWKQKFQEVT